MLKQVKLSPFGQSALWTIKQTAELSRNMTS